MLKSKLEQGMKVTVVDNPVKEFMVVGEMLVDLHGNHEPLDHYDEYLKHRRWFGLNVDKAYKFDGIRWIEVASEVKVNKTEDYSVDYTLIFDGMKTTVILPNDITASTTCLPEDKYDAKKGETIALMKATIKSYTKTLKELTK